MRLMYAMADGPQADPAVADSVRNTMRVVAFQASAEATANTPAKNSPPTKMRL